LLLHFYFCDAGRVQWKHTLYTFAVGDSAYGECFVESPTFTANDYAGEYLDAFLIPFHYTGMNAHAIPDRKRCHFAFVLFFLNGIDDLIHEKFPFPARSGGRTVSSRIGEIATALGII
jgi:hypothetical protein